MQKNDNLFIDIADVAVEDIEVLSQEGSRGVPEFAASTSESCSGQCSCVVNKELRDA